MRLVDWACNCGEPAGSLCTQQATARCWPHDVPVRLRCGAGSGGGGGAFAEPPFGRAAMLFTLLCVMDLRRLCQAHVLPDKRVQSWSENTEGT